MGINPNLSRMLAKIITCNTSHAPGGHSTFSLVGVRPEGPSRGACEWTSTEFGTPVN